MTSLAQELNTFSIVAHCNRTGMLGVAVSTAVPAVGSLCPYIRAGVGAVSTQSWVNPYLAIDALERMQAGHAGPDALRLVMDSDEVRQLRQIGLVDSVGRAASWTGSECTAWAGHRVEPHFAVQGNMLMGESTISEMARAFRDSAELDLAERLMRALEAGQAAGGDKRGKQSASLKIHHQEEYPWLDLRVDEHTQPVAELRRVFEIAKRQLRPFIQGMPQKGQPAGPLPESVTQMLLLPPSQRS